MARNHYEHPDCSNRLGSSDAKYLYCSTGELSAGPASCYQYRDDATILEIDDQRTDKPEKNSVITTGAPPPGATVVGSARIYIRGTPVNVIAYRP
jgi:hypothetical protein